MRTQPSSLILMLGLVVLLLRAPALADIVTVEAEGTGSAGQNDAAACGRRIAIQEAKRAVLARAGSVAAGLAALRDYRLTTDEAAAYMAGLVETRIIAEEQQGTTDRPLWLVRALGRLDTGVAAARIGHYRENAGLKDLLKAARRQNERTVKERNDLVSRLAGEKNPARAEALRKQIDILLAREEADDEINRLWGEVLGQRDSADLFRGQPALPRESAEKLLSVLERTSAATPRNPQASLLLAWLYRDIGNPAAAEGALRRALALDPGNAYLHLVLGRILTATGRHEAALREFSVLERAYPHDPRLIFETALIHRELNDCRQTVAYLKRFLRVTQMPGRSRVAELRTEAQRMIEECGRKPEGKPGRHRPAAGN